jgi:hypothetical protein
MRQSVASAGPGSPIPASLMGTVSPTTTIHRRISGNNREASASMRAGEVRPSVATLFNNNNNVSNNNSNNGVMGSPSGVSHVPPPPSGNPDDDSDSVEEINLHDNNNNGVAAAPKPKKEVVPVPPSTAPPPTASPTLSPSTPQSAVVAAKKDDDKKGHHVQQSQNQGFFARFRRKDVSEVPKDAGSLASAPPASPAVGATVPSSPASPSPLTLAPPSPATPAATANGSPLEKSRSGTLAQSPQTPQTPQQQQFGGVGGVGTISTMSSGSPAKLPVPKKGTAAVRKKHMLFALPMEKQDHLFALKSADRELWISAPTARQRKEWVGALQTMQRIDREQSEHVDRPDGDARDWTIEQVSQWLRSLRLEMYVKVFRDLAVNGQRLVESKNDVIIFFYL